MKLITYKFNNEGPKIGVVVDNRVIDLNQNSNGQIPADMRRFLELGDSGMKLARDLAGADSDSIALESIELMSPVNNPSKVIAIGLNYMDHIRESGMDIPKLATMFCKYPSAIIGPGDEIRWRKTLSNQVDYEAELAVVIGKTARNVSQANAFEFIAGYMNCNDVSARDLQFMPGDQWLRGKCLDTFCPLGPYLVTRDEIPNPENLSIKCLVNDTALQDSNTSEMIYKIPYLIKYLSEAFTLYPGDIIATGTPHGVGAFREPPIWLKHGDVVTVEIEGLGRLTNTCAVE